MFVICLCVCVFCYEEGETGSGVECVLLRFWSRGLDCFNVLIIRRN